MCLTELEILIPHERSKACVERGDDLNLPLVYVPSLVVLFITLACESFVTAFEHTNEWLYARVDSQVGIHVLFLSEALSTPWAIKFLSHNTKMHFGLMLHLPCSPRVALAAV